MKNFRTLMAATALTAFAVPVYAQEKTYDAKAHESGMGRMENMFDRADMDNDERLSQEEFATLEEFLAGGKSGMKAWGYKADSLNSDDMSDTSSDDGDNAQSEDTQEENDSRFESFDADSDGFVDKDEFSEGVKQMRDQKWNEMRTEMFNKIDADGDGSISKEEFDASMEMMHQAAQSRQKDRAKHRQLHSDPEMRKHERQERRGDWKEKRGEGERDGMQQESLENTQEPAVVE